MILNSDGPEGQTPALQAGLSSTNRGFEVNSLVALVQQRAEQSDFLTKVKASFSITVPAGSKGQIRCRVKATSEDKEQIIYFPPRVEESDYELTFLETASTLTRGRTNYSLVELLNQSTKDKMIE